MTAIAHDAEEQRELDAGPRAPGARTATSLRGLVGDEYEHAEHESWAELQSELQRLERRRQSLEPDLPLSPVRPPQDNARPIGVELKARARAFG